MQIIDISMNTDKSKISHLITRCVNCSYEYEIATLQNEECPKCHVLSNYESSHNVWSSITSLTE